MPPSRRPAGSRGRAARSASAGRDGCRASRRRRAGPSAGRRQAARRAGRRRSSAARAGNRACLPCRVSSAPAPSGRALRSRAATCRRDRAGGATGTASVCRHSAAAARAIPSRRPARTDWRRSAPRHRRHAASAADHPCDSATDGTKSPRANLQPVLFQLQRLHHIGMQTVQHMGDRRRRESPARIPRCARRRRLRRRLPAPAPCGRLRQRGGGDKAVVAAADDDCIK